MADPYFGGGSSGGAADPYFGGGGVSVPVGAYSAAAAGGGGTKEHDPASFTGFWANVGEGLKEIGYSLGPGIAELAKAAGSDIKDFAGLGFARDPTKKSALIENIAKPIGLGYKEKYYEPIAAGDWDRLARNIYEDPVGTAFDVLTIWAGAGKAASLAKPELATPRALTLTGPSGKTIEGRSLARAPGPRRAVQTGLDKALKALPASTPGVGEFVRYGREVRREASRDMMRLRLKARPFERSFAKLNKEERIALGALARTPTEKSLEGWKQRIREGAEQPKATVLPLLEDPKVMALWENPTPRMWKAREEGLKLGEESLGILERRGLLTREGAEARTYMPMRFAEEGKAALDEPADVGALRAQVETEGRPQPFYMPDIELAERPRLGIAAGLGRGVSKSPVYRSEGVLFLAGRLALEPDVLTPKYMRDVRYAFSRDLHKELMDAAIKVDRLPTGHVFVRRPVGAPPRAEKIPRRAKTGAQFERELAELLPDEEARVELLTKNRTEALKTDDGQYLAVPERMAQAVSGEYVRASRAERYLWEKPTQMWRALVLNFRPGWLVNNVVGLHLMYALRHAGISGLRAYINAVMNARGPAAVRRMLNVRDPDGISQSFMEELFPEGVEGTFIGTQRPTDVAKGVPQPLRRLSGGLASSERALEGGFRRMATEASLRKSPEVKRVLREMPKDTRRFETAARKALEDPALVRRISDEVNDALGDFLSLSEFEKRVVRRAIPFWAWYRAITKVTLNLALDQPLKLDIMQKLGQIGEEAVEEAFGGEVPDYLRAALPLGPQQGGMMPVLGLGPANPFGTLVPVGQAAGQFVAGKPGGFREVLLQTNPYIQAFIEQASGTDIFSGKDVAQFAPGLIAGIGESAVRSVPQWRLAEGPATKTYGEEELLVRLAQYFGAPYRPHVDVGAARRIAALERTR